MRVAFWQSQFQQSASVPQMWLLEAQRLRHAADLLFNLYCADLGQLLREEASPLELRNLELAGATSLLYGLALENLFKGIIIKSGSPIFADFRIKSGHFKSHNLATLAIWAAISPTADEEDLLRRLTQYVAWAGRYPVPMSYDGMALPQKSVSPEWIPLPLQQGEASLYSTLFSRAAARFSS